MSTDVNVTAGQGIHFIETQMAGFDANNGNWHEEFIVTDLTNKIWLEIDPYGEETIDFDIEIAVKLQIKYFSFPEGQETIKEHTLKVNYTSEGHDLYNQIDLLKLTGGQRVVISILEITIPQLRLWESELIAQKVMLKAQTVDERYYEKEVFQNVDCNNISYAISDDLEIEMYWPPLYYAESYDIEIIHDDMYGTQSFSITTNELHPFDTSPSGLEEKEFYGHATRVNTKNSSLTLPLVNEFSLYRIRIRAVGRQGADFEHRYEHTWSCEESIRYTHLPHVQDELNYQTITTYAEDAKYKVVNEYFDGRMASRQKVTALQSNNYAVVQESIYDGIGRKAVEVLPGPVREGVLSFYPGFNRNMMGDPYSHLDFEGVLDCDPSPGEMSPQSGLSLIHISEPTRPY